jgi:hypothetical protein
LVSRCGQSYGSKGWRRTHATARGCSSTRTETSSPRPQQEKEKDKEKKEVPLLAKAIAGAAGAGASLGHVALSGRISCT